MEWQKLESSRKWSQSSQFLKEDGKARDLDGMDQTIYEMMVTKLGICSSSSRGQSLIPDSPPAVIRYTIMWFKV